MKRHTTSALLISLLFAAAASAASTPDFSGEWKLSLSKSQYGAFPAPAEMTRKVQHHEPSLTMSTRQKGSQGEVTTELKYTTDGKPSVNKLATGDTTGSAHWEGNKLIVESSREVQGGQAKSKETWTLEDGGKTLVITTHVTVPQGAFDVKQVFDRE